MDALTLFAIVCGVTTLCLLAVWRLHINDTANPGLFELLQRANVKCPYCGRAPTYATRGYLGAYQVELSCSLMHVWSVKDEVYLYYRSEIE